MKKGAAVPAKAKGFNAADYAKNGVTEAKFLNINKPSTYSILIKEDQ